MNRFRTIVFDLDGTLVDSYEALATALNATRDLLGQPRLDVSEVKNFVGEGVERLLQKSLGLDVVHPDVRLAFETKYDEVCCTQSRILEEVSETLALLSDSGFRMAVCTNKPTGFSEKILEYLGIAPYFAAVVGPDLAGARKPEARHLLYTLDATGSRPSEALFVGDMPIDVQAARNAGVPVAVLATGSSSGEALRESRPDYFLQRFSELPSIVNGDRTR